MKTLNAYKPVQRDELVRKIQSVDSISTADEPVLSCYLDTRQGSHACHRFIDEQAQQIMNINDVSPAFRTDAAISQIHQLIDRKRHALTQGLALFTSCQQEHPNFEYLALPAPVKNLFSVYPSADIMPLQNMLNTFENITLLVFIDGVMQLYELNLGHLKPLAWAAAPHLEQQSDMRQANTGSTIAQRQLHSVCLSMLKLSSKPLLIAAQAANVESIKSWLPKKIAWRLMDTIELPTSLDHSQAKHYIRMTIQQLKSTQSRTVISRLINSLVQKEYARLGVASSIAALNNSDVECLVIAENYHQPNFWRCDHCATFYHSHNPSGVCSTCGHKNLVFANHVTEASWLAFRRHIPVILVDSDELRYMGGIGCLLSQKQEGGFASIPAQHQPGHLERVA